MDDLLERLNRALADRYRIERELGRGGMATVYLAEERHPQRHVAIKVLDPTLASVLGPERFLREVDLASKLAHPHILPIHAAAEADGLLYYVMPYVEGESLRERLTREKQLPLDDTLRISREVADALSYAHGHGLIHRDIKPENILLESGHAVVADFGIARAIDQAGGTRLTETGVALGTPAYMSPEQAAGSSDLDGRSDLYSLGCVLYEMLAGRPPFVGPTAESVVHQHLAVEPPSITGLRPAVPAGTAAALQRALAKTPADRFNSVALFAEAVGGRTSVVSPPAPRPIARHWKLTIGVVAAAAVIAGLGIAVLLPRRSAARLDPNRVLVVALADQSGSQELQELGRMAQDYVIQVLTEAGFAKVVDPLTALAVTQNVAAAGAVGGPGSIRALAYEAGAGTVVSGTCYAEGDSLYIQARVSDAEEGSLLGTVGPIVGSRAARTELVGRVGREVVAALAPLLNVELGFFEPSAQPATYDAYEAYTEGLDAYLDDAWIIAAQHFERAVAAEPTFARARLWAALALAWPTLTAVNHAKAESLLAPLVESRAQLSRYDRCRLDFVIATWQGNRSGMYDGARCMAQAAPGSDNARREVALGALRLNRPREAIRLLRELDPDHGLMKRWWEYWSYLSFAYYWLGDYQRELEVAQQGQRRYPTSLDMRLLEARALVALGRLDDVAVKLKPVESLPSRSTLGDWATRIGDELRARGYGDAARAAFEKAIAWYQSRPQETEAARAGLAGILYQAERWDEALRLYGELARQYPENPGYLGALGRLAARQGDRRAALRISERLQSVQRPDPWVLPSAALERARIAAALGDREAAVTLLQQVIDRIWGPIRLQDDIDFASLRDYPPFQELLRPKG